MRSIFGFLTPILGFYLVVLTVNLTMFTITYWYLLGLCKTIFVLTSLALNTDFFQIVNRRIFFGLVKSESSILWSYHDIINHLVLVKIFLNVFTDNFYNLSFGFTTSLYHILRVYQKDLIIVRVIVSRTNIVGYHQVGIRFLQFLPCSRNQLLFDTLASALKPMRIPLWIFLM